MTENRLRRLESCGQSVWTDYIRRSFVRNGDLERLVNEDGITGVTSNPTIFEKAIAGSDDYDAAIRTLVDHGADIQQVFQSLVSEDIRAAAGVLRPVYDRQRARDGYVSVEVSPEAAHDRERTVREGQMWWRLVDKPNVMIKVPATPEGIPAIEELTAAGINVNITLIFAVDVYDQVMDAYMRGLERRVREGLPIDRIGSVASFFVSRVDTLVDHLLEQRNRDKDLMGKAAIANAKIAYQNFQTVVASDRWKQLAANGAQVQRPLWASTSTKNPAYPDTLYVDSLIGPDTVNTMPLETISAFRDHGNPDCGAVTADVDEAHQIMEKLAAAGIDMTEVTDQLTREGVQKFEDSLHQLMDVLTEKVNRVREGTTAREHARLGKAQGAADGALAQLEQDDAVRKIWDKDGSLWSTQPDQQEEISQWLGWLNVTDAMIEHLGRLNAAAESVRKRGFTHAVVLGMGGSSLAPYVFSQTFSPASGSPKLVVLDSTDPGAVERVEREIDIRHTLFIVSTKSGTTTETLSFLETFWVKVQQAGGNGDQFIAITDPGTKLESLATERKFATCYLNQTDIGGRYSALSYFGLVPAAVMGIDLKELLGTAKRIEQACAACVPADRNPGAWLGATMGGLAQIGRNKVTFFLSPKIQTLGLWLEQLLAESTGKQGKGLVPVPERAPGKPSDYSDDRVFMYLRLEDDDNAELDSAVNALEQSGQPVVRFDLENLYDLGAEFFRWEFATAIAGSILGIDAFNQPNVQESKDNTKRLLGEFEKLGRLPEPGVAADQDGVRLAVDGASVDRTSGGSLPEKIASLLDSVSAPQYIGIMAYIAPTERHDEILWTTAATLRDARKVAVTVGYGPRFLHSTGQLHKGGPAEGVFIQIVAQAHADVMIPGEDYSFATLIRAQALGDFQALEQHGLPAIRLDLPDEKPETLNRVSQMIVDAAKARA
ncbi:MAG TPA: bifunctional transaldolase/phosoglucose isomerase [Chloroflexota bacterium]|nr:bifunctional transaldolase/phosoglucose isomerase [Chloroflexota bacterium]